MTLQELTTHLQQYIQQNPSTDSIDEAEISSIYQQLIDCLTDHNHLYYIENSPIISDKEYDDLFSYIKKIEEYFPHIISSNSPTQWLVGQVQEGFSQATHQTPMLSLENSYNTQDLIDRDEFIVKNLNKNITSSWVEWTNVNEIEGSYEPESKKHSYYIEPKFDGISVEVIYKNGQLHQAITRGDGITGDDITHNVKTIKNLPATITEHNEIHLRWEIMMPKSVRKQLNDQRTQKGEQPFANTRNAAAGSIKLLDTNEVSKRWLVCFLYDIANNQQYSTHEQTIQYLKSLWLPIFDRHKICHSIQEVIDITQNPETQAFFHAQDVDFDGLVIKVNETDNRTILWSTQHHPRRAIAYKFPAQQISTQIQSVDRQVGRSGVITPVANLTPVQLSWVTISRVSLHNSDFITTKDIQLHDYVRIQRSGEVIPYIVWVIKERRENTHKIIPPTHCPSCWHNTSHIDMHTYCTNHACPAQLQEKIEHFVSKQCMDIEGIGSSIAEILIKHKIIKTVDELYTFTQPEKQAMLRSLPWFADKKVAEIIKQLEASKSKPLRRLIHGLGIPNIGKKTAMMIQEAIQTSVIPGSDPESRTLEQKPETFTLNELISYLTNPNFLTQIYGIGEKMVQSLQAFFHDQTNITIVQNIIHAWVNIQPTDTIKNTNSPFTGQHFAITGTFPVSRDLIIAACEAQGMIFDASPTKQSSYMFIGDNPWSKKAKAQEYSIPLISSREQLLTQFPFLTQIPTTNKVSNTPTAQSLF
jgi:DNA ligase (NAD+)